MNWKLKIIKLSTYNSLNEQSKLKDQIIIDSINKQSEYGIKIKSLELLIKELQTTLANRTGEKIELQQRVITLDDILNHQSKLLFSTNNENKELKAKISRIDQPRNKGKFTTKNK